LCNSEEIPIQNMSKESKGHRPRVRIGEAFNPFGLFRGIFIAEALVRSRIVSQGAKLAWGRLARYAGGNGDCFPAVGTLAEEIGIGERQCQKYLTELEHAKLIRRIDRFADGAQRSNNFEFLWHSIFEEGANDCSAEGVHDCLSPGVNDRAPKESQIEESHEEESHQSDQDYPPTNRQQRDSPSDHRFVGGGCRQYPRLREALADYMADEDDEERIYPSDRLVVDVMDVAGGASEDEVLRCLRYLCQERGLRRGAKHGPRTFSWFKTVVQSHFEERGERAFVANPATSRRCSQGAADQ
jgi:hypothetical protein